MNLVKPDNKVSASALQNSKTMEVAALTQPVAIPNDSVFDKASGKEWLKNVNDCLGLQHKIKAPHTLS